MYDGEFWLVRSTVEPDEALERAAVLAVERAAALRPDREVSPPSPPGPAGTPARRRPCPNPTRRRRRTSGMPNGWRSAERDTYSTAIKQGGVRRTQWSLDQPTAVPVEVEPPDGPLTTDQQGRLGD